eukprot:m.54057 g.54057  ORF g.54057 m.54057 type:complete len:364 (-) comp12839_c0_seq1:100-1191(-)
MDPRVRLNNILLEAVKRNDLLHVRLILAQGANANAIDLCGWAALHFAAEHGKRTAILFALLHGGARVNAICPYTGETPLHVAAASGNMSAVKLLLNCGADLFMRNFKGQTAREVAKQPSIFGRLFFGVPVQNYLAALEEAVQGSLPRRQQTQARNPLQPVAQALNSEDTPSPPRPRRFESLHRRRQLFAQRRRDALIPQTSNTSQPASVVHQQSSQESQRQQRQQQEEQRPQQGGPSHRQGTVAARQGNICDPHLDRDRLEASNSVRGVKLSESQTGQLISALECGICLEVLQNPITLPCGHSFCSGCCKQLVSSSTGQYFACPLDRSKFPRCMPLGVAVTLRNIVTCLDRLQQHTLTDVSVS